MSREVMPLRSASHSQWHSAQAQIRGSNPLSPAISRSPNLNSGEDLGPGANAGHGCHNARTRDKWLSED